MAEALGITAASLQIAELFAKAAIRGYKLIKQLQDAPEEIRRKTQCLEDFRSLCNSCRDGILKAYQQIQATNARVEDIARISELLDRAGATLRSLETILSKLGTQGSDTRAKRWVKAAKTRVRNGDISEHLNELGRITNLIQAFFGQLGWMIAINHRFAPV
ncbi:uncharacterized protein PG998_002651 [Apiospora kogelbergensis]|uniref:uncharacterized protein n=1 Tax=Apiospora kogelbergensis TaxID=1337665 RepID=UPI0031310AA9